MQPSLSRDLLPLTVRSIPGSGSVQLKAVALMDGPCCLWPDTLLLLFSWLISPGLVGNLEYEGYIRIRKILLHFKLPSLDVNAPKPWVNFAINYVKKI
jgi:hypothetical protein